MAKDKYVRTFLLTAIFLMMSPSAFSNGPVKKPNVAGQFYTADPLQLTSQVDHFLKQAPPPSEKSVKVIIAPHAGYVYSGAVAGHSFKAASRQTFKTIVVLAPSHYFPFDGIAVWKEGGFQTPLGTVSVDQDFAQKLIDSHDMIYEQNEVFEREHSLEVEIPFLQRTFKNFKIVPIIMGQPSYQLLDEFARIMSRVIGDREDVLIVVSSDMSHYHDAKTAQAMDARTLEAVKGFQTERLFKECHLRTMEMCGCVPVTAALLYAKQRGFNELDVLKYAHSGHVTGDNDRVVGYSSVVIYGKDGAKAASQGRSADNDLSQDQKKRLVEIAKQTLNEFVRTEHAPEFKETDPRLLKKDEGVFVTLHHQGRLRGCMGNILNPGKPLYLLVRDMAVTSSRHDPRFEPVKAEELNDIEVEVSVLSKPKVVKSHDEIVMGVHGVIISRGGRGGVFLPQVATETGWTKEEFLSQLCYQKAGLPPDCWQDPKTKIEVFTALVFSEKDI